MGCFSSGKQTSTNQVTLPKWLDDASKKNIELASGLSKRPYEAYGAPRIMPFTSDQLGAHDLVRGGAQQYGNPNTGNVDQIQQASTAPYMQFNTPMLFDPITGSNGQQNNFQDYMNPYIQSVVADSIGEMNRQAQGARKDIDSQATMAGAFGDTGHAIQQQELERNLIDQTGQMANQGYAQAFDTAAGLRGTDINRLLAGFQTNAGQYNQALDRAMTGGAQAANTQGQDLQNYLNYAGALNQSGAQQQNLGQQSLDLGYQDFQQQFNYPQKLLAMLNQTTGVQPHGQTTTSTTPTASTFGKLLGGAASIGSMFI